MQVSKTEIGNGRHVYQLEIDGDEEQIVAAIKTAFENAKVEKNEGKSA